ncbi:MAG TPA: hypothetical protein VLM89_05555 [Phycisphaerae bacterium]|nr:hypothetical protein [Phycisphaerae bacterium]
MPKSKHAPALFELIDTRGQTKATSKLAVPKWFKSHSPTQPNREPVSAPRSAETPKVEKRPSVSGEPGVVRRLRMKLHGDRVQFSLNSTNVVVVAGVVLLALLTYYILGRNLGAGTEPAAGVAAGLAAIDPVSETLQQPANADILDPVRRATLMATPPAATGEPKPAPEAKLPEKAPTTPGVSKGPNRILIESFKPADIKSAEFVLDWLGTMGLQTELRRAGDSIWLLTVDGYDLGQPGQKEVVDKLIEDLKSLGESCRRELAARKLTVYTLSQPYTRRLDR